MVTFGISNAEALRRLSLELGEGPIDIFFAAGRKTSPTYTREHAVEAYKKYQQGGERMLPPLVLTFCHDFNLFPAGMG